jgi:serine/threonine-protein kinase
LAEQVLGGGFLDPADLASAQREQVGRYRVERLLGEGAAGEVYLARDELMDRPVAVKVLKQGPSADRLRRELEVLAKLEHPGVVAIHDAGVDRGQAFFVMAYAGEVSLAKADLSLEAWVAVLAGVLDACDYVHGQGVVHRDLKPDNVLLDERGRPAIADFGIAKLLETDKRLTRTGAIMGTPAYMAPEQVLDAEIGPWTDVYAAGAMLYERLCGRCPVEATSLMEFAARMAASDQEPDDPREHVPEASPRLAGIAMRAVSRDPQERYPSAASMAEALRDWLAEGDLTQLPSREVVIAASVVAVAVLAFALFVARNRTAAEPPTPDPVEPTSAAVVPDAPAPADPAEPAPADPAPPAPTEPAPSTPAVPAGDALDRWLANPPDRSQLDQAFREAAAALPAKTGWKDGLRFARLCWAVAFRAIDERWPPPARLEPLVQLSEHPRGPQGGQLASANAWGLRWWFERDAQGQTQSAHFDRAATLLGLGIVGGRWEADASAVVLYLLAIRNNAGREMRARFVKRKAGEAMTRLRASAPPSEARLLEEFERRLGR